MELKKEQFEAQQELAKVNGEISTAKAILANLKIDIQKFLDARKVKELEMLKKLYEESSGLVNDIQKNYKDIKVFYRDAVCYVGFLKEMQESIGKMISDYSEDVIDFTQFFKKETEKLANIRKDLEADRDTLKSDRKLLEDEKVVLEKEKVHLESQQRTLETSFKELKKLWDKNL